MGQQSSSSMMNLNNRYINKLDQGWVHSSTTTVKHPQLYLTKPEIPNEVSFFESEFNEIQIFWFFFFSFFFAKKQDNFSSLKNLTLKDLTERSCGRPECPWWGARRSLRCCCQPFLFLKKKKINFCFFLFWIFLFKMSYQFFFINFLITSISDSTQN